jgi:hypothetical protein
MGIRVRRGGILLALVAAASLAIAGCGEGSKGGAKKAEQGNSDQVAKAGAQKGHDHGGWWCDEHGIPEDMCSMCSAKVAKACKAKGDWCDKHDRARSQCFLCEPELRERFAAMYRAKYGKEPPPPTEEK